MVSSLAKGAIRNSFVAGSLWFITCLFVMQILFFMMRKIFRKRLLVFIIAVLVCYISQYVFGLQAFSKPKWIYNIDSALYYILFYAIGFIIFPSIMSLFELDTKGKRCFFAISGIISAFYTGCCFLGKDYLTIKCDVPLYAFVSVAIRSLVIIYFYFVVAKIFEDVKPFVGIGRNTLYLCGSEFLIRNLYIVLVGLIGGTIQYTSPLAAYVYTGILLWTANKYLMPIEKGLINKIYMLPKTLRRNDFAKDIML